MFGFGGSNDKQPKGDIFNIEEIRQLVLDFPPPTNNATASDALIPLASGDGYTTRDALSKAYAELIKGRYGKIPIEALEKQLDVDRTTLYNVLRSREDFMQSKCKGFVLTICEQERILQDIYAKTQSKFIRAKDVAEEHEIDIQSVGKLVLLSEKSSHETTLQLLDAPGQSRSKSLELGNSWVHTLETLLKLGRNVRDQSIAAHTGARVAEFKLNEMFGLDVPTFARLAHKLCQEFNGHEPLYGFFESGKDTVRYVTKSYLLRKAKRMLKEVAMGEEAFCDLQDLCLKYPTLLPNIDAAKQLAVTEVLHKDGNKYKWHFIEHYAIGDVGVNSTAKKCMEILGPQRYLNTEPYVQAFPKDIHPDVHMLLQNRIVEFWRYCGGEVQAVLGLNEWMVLRTIINDIDTAAKRIGRTCADDAYKRQVLNPSLQAEEERKLFLQNLQEESDLPFELLERLWDDDRVKIKTVGIASFGERIAELRTESKAQLESTWKSRAYIPANNYDQALEMLEAGAFKDQLRDLLQVHLAQDVVPNTLKRLRTKGLIREAAHTKQVEKLEVAVSKKDLPVLKSMEKFHEKIGFTSLSSTELAVAREQQLGATEKAMSEDTDGPRLFLSTILVLLARNSTQGIVYATGKFAPRLMRMLKSTVDDDTYRSLVRLKDAVKAGKITDEDRSQMRRLAKANSEGVPNLEEERDDGSVTEKEDQ